MDTGLLIPTATTADDLTVGVLVDALTVVAYSAHIVGSGLKRRGTDGDEVEDEAAERTTTYFKTEPHVVRAAYRSLFLQQPCDLRTLAENCLRLRTDEVLALGKEWLEHHRGKVNELVKPFLH